MESIKTWFQDWSDACEYARECAPDLSFLAIKEPYSAFLAIAVLCFVLWGLNERRLKVLLDNERRPLARREPAAAQRGGLDQALDRMKEPLRPEAKKQAA